jgi:hypothetical protein
MPELHIATELSIPQESVTQTFAILAKRGSGKTYTALVMVEEMLKAGLQVVVIDPVGVCWGLRTSADGKEAGLPIIVLGGEHGDLGIDSTIGSAIADFVIQERQSVVIDLSSFSNNEMVRLVTDFAERLYQRNRTPLHLILDEADSFAPQKPLPGEQRMLGAIDKIVRRGRAKGLGVSLVSQRPAVINKNVLTQIEVLIALRTVSPQDRKAIEEWIEVHGTQEQRKQLLNSLASLPIGTAWIWSPGWLDVFQCIKIRQRKTFDSSSTPKIGSSPDIPKVLAKVNLPLLRLKFAEITGNNVTQTKIPERRNHKQTELDRLRKLVVNLETQLQERVVAQPIFQDGEVERLESAVHSLTEVGNQIIAIAKDLNVALSKAKCVDESPTSTNPSHKQSKPIKTPSASSSSATAKREKSVLHPPQQKILDALAAFEAIGLKAVHRSNVAVFSNQSPRSSAFTANLSALRSQNLIYYPTARYVSLTEHGRVMASPVTEIPALSHLHTAWYSKLSKPQSKIIQVLVERYPTTITRDVLAKLAGQSATSSAYTDNLGTLRSLGVIDYPKPKHVVATKLLFPLAKTVTEVGLLGRR